MKGGLQTANDGRMLYAVRSWLVLSHKDNPTAQTYLRGHNSPISCLQISVRHEERSRPTGASDESVDSARALPGTATREKRP